MFLVTKRNYRKIGGGKKSKSKKMKRKPSMTSPARRI